MYTLEKIICHVYSNSNVLICRLETKIVIELLKVLDKRDLTLIVINRACSVQYYKNTIYKWIQHKRHILSYRGSSVCI